MISKGMVINDRYVIIKSVGEGGMANVYLAHDKILARDVAIKVLRGDLSKDEKFIRRFQREALAASSLSNPNIVKIYDVGDSDNLYYIVMEYIKGKTLKQLIKKRGALNLEEAIDIMIQLTSGVAKAHESYIIHRDLKPQNIMIEDSGLIKITDFGIAVALNAGTITQTNSVMGSVHYLPPEQVSGDKPTIKSDIYSLGIIFYELLTGILPFKGENAIEIALKHLKETIPSVRKQNNKIPQSVENIIYKATAKNPKNRYDDAREMEKDLKEALSEEHKNDQKIEFFYPEKDFDSSNKVIVPVVKEDKKEKEEKTEQFARTVEQEKPKKRSFKVWPLVLSLSSFVLIVFIIALVLTLIAKKPKEVLIPDITNMSLVDAKDVLEGLGLKIDNIEKVSSASVQKGSIVKTDPEVGSKVKTGREIIIYESLGEEEIILENYVGKNNIEVKTSLEQVKGLKVEIKKQEVDNASTIDSQIILKQEPAVGTKLKKGDKVILYIPDLYDKYPDFIGEKWQVESIKEFCKKYGVILNIQEESDTGKEKGTVIYQSRKPGSIVENNATLTVRVAK